MHRRVSLRTCISAEMTLKAMRAHNSDRIKMYRSYAHDSADLSFRAFWRDRVIHTIREMREIDQTLRELDTAPLYRDEIEATG